MKSDNAPAYYEDTSSIRNRGFAGSNPVGGIKPF